MKATGLNLGHNLLNVTFFKPFQQIVWVFILISAILVIFWRNFIRCFAHKSVPVARAKAIVSFAVVLEIFILIRVFRARYYKGKLVSNKPELPFPNLEAYVKAVEAGTTATFADTAYSGSSLHYINNSDHPLLRRLVKALDHNPIQITKSLPALMNLIDKYHSTYTLITSETYFKYLRSKYCDLIFIPWPTGRRYLGLFYKKH